MNLLLPNMGCAVPVNIAGDRVMSAGTVASIPPTKGRPPSMINKSGNDWALWRDGDMFAFEFSNGSQGDSAYGCETILLAVCRAVLQSVGNK